jgi:hypothetical protein
MTLKMPPPARRQYDLEDKAAGLMGQGRASAEFVHDVNGKQAVAAGRVLCGGWLGRVERPIEVSTVEQLA